LPSAEAPSSLEKRHIPIPVVSRKSPLLAKVFNGDDYGSSDGSVGSNNSLGECFPMSFGSPDVKRILKTSPLMGDDHNVTPRKIDRTTCTPDTSPLLVLKPKKTKEDVPPIPIPQLVKPVIPQHSPTFLIATGPRECDSPTPIDNDINPEPTPRAINTFFQQHQQGVKSPFEHGSNGSNGSQGSQQEVDPDIFRNFSYQNLMNLQSSLFSNSRRNH